MILQKGNNIYYYLPLNGSIEPLYKYLIRKQSEEKIPEGWDITD